MHILVNYGGSGMLRPHEARTGHAMAGIRTAMTTLCGMLARRGHDVHVVARCAQPGQYDGVAWHDRASFARLSDEQTFDVLVAIPEVLSLLMPVRARARVVWTGNAFQGGDCALAVPHDWAPEIGPSGRTARLYSMSILHRYVDRIVVKSRWQAAYISERQGIPATMFEVAYNGVPLEHYRGEPPVRERCRMVYTSEARRGLDILLSLFPRVRAAVPEAELHVFGYEYDAVNVMPARVDARQAGVVWRGRVDKGKLASELRSAALMAYPCTLKETFCTAVAEAQAAGLPVVTSDRAALAERVTSGVDGYLIAGRPAEPDYHDAFVQAVVTLLRDDDQRTRMSGAAAAMAHQAYDWESIAARWEAILLRLVEGREARLPLHDPALDLTDPSLLTVTDRGAAACIPPDLAVRCVREAWGAYGYDPGTVPGLPSG